MRLLSISLLLFLSCTSEPDGSSGKDLEAHINELLRSVNERGANVPGVLVDELSPNGFLFGPETSVIAQEIRRLRSIDSRILVDVLALRNGSSFELSIWLEERDGLWLISGWSPQLKRLVDKTIEPSSAIDVPRRFAAASLRGSPQPIRVPGKAFSEMHTPTPAPQSWLKVRSRVRSVTGRCKARGALDKKLRGVIPQIRRCHETHFPGRSRAAGRVILRFAEGVVALEESTTTSQYFTQCVRQAVTAAVPEGKDCNYLIDLLMSTR